MKFDSIKNDRTYIKRVEIKKGEIKVGLLGILSSIDSMELNEIEDEIKFKYLDTHNEIKFEFNQSSNAIVRVLALKDKIATLEILIFAFPLKCLYEKLYIKLDEKLLDKGLRVDDFLITINKNKYLAITDGNNIKDELFDECAFTLLSDTKRLAIERINVGDDSIVYKATKLMEIKQKELRGLKLIKIKEAFEFKDGSIKASVKEALESGELVSGYLSKWDEYATKMGDLLLQKARDIGEVEIKDVDKFSLKIEFDLREKLNNNDFICIMDTTPSYLEDKEINFENYMQEHLSQENKIKTYKIENITSDSIELEKQENMNLEELRGRKFTLSIFGDIVALKRKYKARKRMLEGKSANPMLPMIFASELSESLKETLKMQKRNTYAALSDRIRQKIFKTTPTENQEQAIKMAINTKDIALIQGPPGTGKTTVLNAIIERLNELSDKDLDKGGSIFIGGFQHSAVENLIQRMNLNGIPTPKYGKKSNAEDSLANYYSIMNWSEKIAENIIIKEDSKRIKDFKNLATQYLKRPSHSKQKGILKTIINTTEVALQECRAKARAMLNSLQTSQTSDDLSLIYALRSNEISFNDDGVDRNLNLLSSEFKDLLTAKERQILSNKSFSKDLIELKEKLIERFSPEPKFEKEKPNKAVLELIDEVINALNKLSPETRINVALAEFKQKLQSNPFALKDMLKAYSVAFSATIGQSVSKELLAAKGIKENDTEQNETYSYDTIIVDEAAMVSPLDLFLVLVLAKHRIILVGDHRQLPHMLDDEVLKKMEQGEQGEKIESELLKQSIFSFLKTRAEELEKIDGVRRFITLNKQFRTHPLLGNLVSDIFYKDYGEAYESARPESDFHHGLKGIENIPAIWINLSKDKGKDKKSGTSRMRECEIETIATQLIAYLKSEAGANLSYGIISFYRAQVDAIKERIKKLKISHTQIRELLERVKVGSVDEFQGNEFDIVFLSAVRSGTISNDASPQSAFGFLAVPNRLCVAMSRQKKCLIVLGDREYFKSDLARQCVRGMYEFALLCEAKGRVL